MQAVILAGGLGTRLRPITEKVPKCMVPIGDKPFLFYLLDLLKHRGVDDVIICSGYLGEQIEYYFGTGKDIGLNLRYSREKDVLLGTGGALKQAQKLVNSHFLVINGDTYLDINYQNVYQEFIAGKKQSLIVVHPAVGNERGDIEISKINQLVISYAKNSKNIFRYVNAGVMAFDRQALFEIVSGCKVSLETEVFPTLIKNGEVASFITKKKFYDIGTFANLGDFESCLSGVDW